MKKTLASVLLIMVIIVASNAQGFFFRLGGGYGLPMATSIIGDKYLRTDVYNIDGTISTYSDENVSASYGAGLNLNIAGGYKFNGNFAVDLNLQYLIGTKFEVSDTYIDNGDGYSGKDESITKSYSKALFINPSLIITPVTGKRVPYARIGIIAGSPTVYGDESQYYDLDGTSTSSRKWEYKKGMAFGLQSALGINWMISEKLDVFTEVNFVSMTYYAKEYELTEYISNDNDILSSISVSQKKTIYKKKIDPNAEYDSTQPTNALRESTPFSSVTFQAGIKFTL